MKELVKSAASRAGFAAVGVASAGPVEAEEYLRAASEQGRIASMGWLARDPAARCDPCSLLPAARSVICCALAYGDDGISGSRITDRRSRAARFARGAEYHAEVKRRLQTLWDAVRARAPEARARLCCDTSPILEKALAQRAGIGWIGKHTVLVNKELGSWFVLGEIITDIEIEPDAPHEDLCGECTRCLDACPTRAILSPRALDSRRCISYYTTGERGVAPEGVGRMVSPGAFGCDLCQEVCPYNNTG